MPLRRSSSGTGPRNLTQVITSLTQNGQAIRAATDKNDRLPNDPQRSSESAGTRPSSLSAVGTGSLDVPSRMSSSTSDGNTADRASHSAKMPTLSARFSHSLPNLQRAKNGVPVTLESAITTLCARGYEVGDELGTGGQGFVVSARRAGTPPEDCAIKIIGRRHRKLEAEARREVAALDLLKHPSIVRLIESFDDENFIYIVTELLRFCKTSALIGHTRVLDEEGIQMIIHQLLITISFIHSQGIAHRDIKLDNLLVDLTSTTNVLVKVIDFGMCYVRDRDALLCTDWPGTSPYECPEVVLRVPYVPEQADMWCVGVVIYCLVERRYPFPARNSRERRRQIVSEEPFYCGRNWNKYPPVLHRITNDLLSKEGAARPCAQDCLSKVEAEWAQTSPNKQWRRGASLRLRMNRVWAEVRGTFAGTE